MNRYMQGYHVLIVDDEPHVLEGLKTMIDWEELECSKLYFCESSEEAKKILNNNTIDLLITDIRLPGESGLDLIESLKSQYESMKLVVMSGYRDFKYVKRAMNIGVDGYLIKPVFQEDAFDVLRPIIQALNNQTRNQTYSEESALFIIKDYLVNDCKLGNQKSSLMEYIEANGYYLLGCWHREKAFIHRQIQEIMYEDTLKPQGIILYEDDYGVISLVKEELRPKWIDLQFKFNHEMVCQEGEFGKSFDQLRTWFESFRHTLPNLCHYMKGNDLFDMRMLRQDSFVKEEKELRKLFKKIITEDEGDLLDIGIENFFFLLTENESEFVSIKKRFMDFYYRLINEVDFILQDDNHSEEIRVIPQKLNEGTLETLLVFFENRILKIMEISKKQRGKCKESIVCQVEELMKQDLSNNLTLTEMAKKVHLHPAYLGQKLSDNWGESFKRRLNRMRIEQAVKLLLDDKTPVGIESCAYQVGFKNYLTFLKYFKLFYKTTPRKYIENYRN